jgi:Rrf2 family protein
MLRINRRTDYAIRVMLALAKQGEGARISTQKIQEEMQIPHAFLQRIIADLARSKLIHTFPGPKGGLQLAHAIDSVSMLDVYEVIEGPLLISPCLEGPDECPLEEGCPVRPRWGHMQAMIAHEMSTVTLSQLAEEAAQIKFRRDTI